MYLLRLYMQVCVCVYVCVYRGNLVSPLFITTELMIGGKSGIYE